MSMTDPIADMLTRIRNATVARHEVVAMPHSRLKEDVAKILAQTGFVRSVEKTGEGCKQTIQIALKYTADGESIINGIERVSKPGRRIYVGYGDLRQVRNGMGVAILSTPTGVMTDTTARTQKVGGEYLINIW